MSWARVEVSFGGEVTNSFFEGLRPFVFFFGPQKDKQQFSMIFFSSNNTTCRFLVKTQGMSDVKMTPQKLWLHRSQCQMNWSVFGGICIWILGLLCLIGTPQMSPLCAMGDVVSVRCVLWRHIHGVRPAGASGRQVQCGNHPSWQGVEESQARACWACFSL